MTIYRRRLASSFHALRQTMEKRKGGVGGLITAADEARIDENIADQVEAGEEIDIETVSEDERRALAFEEIATIGTIVDDIKRLPTDTKEDGESEYSIGPDVPILAPVPGDKSLLKPGAAVFLAGPKGEDGTVTANFMYVEKDGIKPPM